MRKLWIIVIGIVILSAVSITIFVYNGQPVLLSNAENSTCNSLYFSGDEKANLVFISGKSEAKKYADSLFQISPYSKDNFNVYYIDNYIPNCNLYKGIALLCYSKEILKLASLCPNDYIVVPKEENSNIRSSTYMNVISVNTAAPTNTLAHELGHAIAGLADEYVPATLPAGQENCKSSFSNIPVSFPGCSESGLQRSIDTGLMRSLYVNILGSYDESLISSRLNKKSEITGNAVSNQQNCQSNYYYLISANYSNSNIVLNSKSIEHGCINPSGNGQFTYNINLKDGSKIPGNNFNPELIFTDIQNKNDQQASGGPIAYEGEFILKVPIIENADNLEISKEGILAKININDGDARLCLIY